MLPKLIVLCPQFERLFAIGFEGRTDKRDARKLASALTEFSLEWLSGVAYEDIPEKAVPPVCCRHQSQPLFAQI